ncbi:MAG TPA: permease-like cell division protein FtsX [Candidatus Dormibacteraeota bacterium]|nr:permease-like cell division protein FtsX [Candidatus Dormibacteraeota bacterium]
MRLWRHLVFALSSAWQSFWRNAAVSLAAVGTITLILALAGVNLLIGHTLGGILDQYKSRVSVISISIADRTPLSTISDFEGQLRSDPRVSSVTFITKDEALARFSADPQNADIARQIQGNPLAAKLEVHVASLSDVAAIDAEARAWRGADPADPTDYQGEFITRMLQLSQWVDWAGLVVLGILMLVSVFIVMNTIRTAVYHRRQEIEVMKLVGATEWFVRGPFVIEGVLTGVLAASIALGALLLAYHPFVDRFHSDLFFIPLGYDPAFVTQLARDVLVGGALLGALGSYIGVRRYVRV